MPSSSHHLTREAKKKNTKFVVVSFCASLLSFFAAGIYDCARPIALHRVVPVLENILWSTRNAFFTPENAGIPGENRVAASAAAVISPSCPSPMVRVAVRAFAEAAILMPLLFVLPLTQRRWKELQLSRPDLTRTREEARVCFLLRIISWVIWAASAVLLILGIFIGSHLLGVVSFSALLSFFAQSVNGVGCLLSLCSYEDDIQRETWSVGEYNNVLVSAASWALSGNNKIPSDIMKVKSSKKHAGSEVSTEQKKHATLGAEKSAKLPSQRTPLLTLKRMCSVENIDFLIFFFIKIMLLQTPYFLQVGLQLIHSCVNCSGLLHFRDDPSHHSNPFQYDENPILPREIPGVMAFVCTIFVPLFTHGVGGKLFNGARWSFHHPFDGGKSHVTAQATGWSLVGLAGFLHLAFMILGMGNQHVYLLHSGSVLSWFAESILLYSLVDFRPSKTPCGSLSSETAKDGEISERQESFSHAYHFLGYIQDFIVTNLHWFYCLWFIVTLMGFNVFSPTPTKSFLCAPPSEVALNMSYLLFSSAMPYIFVSFQPRRKKWRWNIFGLYNNAFEAFMCQPHGLFSGSELRMEDEAEDYQAEGAMFAMAPHGILPTSVLPVCYQFSNIFSDVCVFFGSQIDLCPFYRFFLGMRGGFMPVEKKHLVQVMQTRQSVALVPGGVSEMLHCVPHGTTINISIKHKGFIRLAIQHGYDLVPTFFFHANDQYDNPMGKLQHWTYEVAGVPVGVPLYTSSWWLPISNRTQIKVALGKRIPVKKKTDPTTEEIDVLHRKFYEEVLRVWQTHKDGFGYGARELAYVT